MKKINIDFKYEPHSEKREIEAINSFNKKHNPDTLGFSTRFYVFLTIGFVIVVSGILWIAPAIDQNPILYLALLIVISLALWAGINASAKRSR